MYHSSVTLEAIAYAVQAIGGKANRPSNGSLQVSCPLHDDRNPSMSVTIRDGKILVYCHAGCTIEKEEYKAVMQAWDIKPEPRDHDRPQPKRKRQYRKGAGVAGIHRPAPQRNNGDSPALAELKAKMRTALQAPQTATATQPVAASPEPPKTRKIQ